ncbi:hypothetical protein BC831DRAFT_550601 [Entophlyctis helioformis]|nr:hypothetical protein BC831DRAFT_550601 [Entophlyctis helioformis]
MSSPGTVSSVVLPPPLNPNAPAGNLAAGGLMVPAGLGTYRGGSSSNLSGGDMQRRQSFSGLGVPSVPAGPGQGTLGGSFKGSLSNLASSSGGLRKYASNMGLNAGGVSGSKPNLTLPMVQTSASNSNIASSSKDSNPALAKARDEAGGEDAEGKNRLLAPPGAAPNGSSYKELYDDMHKEKVKTRNSSIMTMKDEMMAEKKERVRKEIKSMSLSAEEREYYVEAFCIFDLDGSGTIDVEELGAVMRSLGLEDVSEAEIRAMMSQIDQDGNGEISIVEFVDLMATVRTRGGIIETEADIREAFALVDFDKDGYVTAQDLAQAFVSVGEKITHEQALDMIRVTDGDLDGRVDFADFYKMLTSTIE